MAYDFKNDSSFKETKNGMFAAHWRSVGWGMATGGLAAIGMLFLPAAIIALPLAIFTGYKAYQARVDERTGQADLDAQRSAARIVEAMAKVQSPAQAQSNDMEWQKRIIAAQAASRGTGKSY